VLHPELAAGVYGMAHAHSLQVEVVDIVEVAGCQLLKPGSVLSLLHFTGFHQSPSFFSLGDSDCNIIDLSCNSYSSYGRR